MEWLFNHFFLCFGIKLFVSQLLCFIKVFGASAPKEVYAVSMKEIS